MWNYWVELVSHREVCTPEVRGHSRKALCSDFESLEIVQSSLNYLSIF